MIICVTPNAAIDRTLVVPGFATEGIFRPQQTIVDAGGKGINVARAVRILGGEPVCAGFLGGHTGQLIAQLVTNSQIQADWTFIAEGESRTCVIVIDPDKHTSVAINEHGTPVNAADWSRMGEMLLERAKTAYAICFCGSMPPGSPMPQFKTLLQALVQTSCHIWIDTSGEALAVAAEVQGVNLKINDDEAGALLGLKIHTQDDAAQAAALLQQKVNAQVVLTRGNQGVVLVNAEGQWMATPPAVKVISAVGSGDSFLAGLLVALERGELPQAALRHAVAAGTANAQTAGGAYFSLEDFNQLLAQTQVVEC